jgi:hypothetical protein
MRTLLGIVIIALTVGTSATVGYLAGRTRTAIERLRWAKTNGFTLEHNRIYKRSINTLNRIVDAWKLDEPMDPMLRHVQLPKGLSDEAQKVMDDYRKEINA